ncbi:hypothetical protein EYC80_008274 [Monilinia laxa]|uniref:Uncharacterized protein n=1 Tax=Monilinia laxa TaxID=61186 RepID=A0A5N6JU22_MONLA|nr:hypothetical protein EYC80_008274 [Monilinia laxa]
MSLQPCYIFHGNPLTRPSTHRKELPNSRRIVDTIIQTHRVHKRITQESRSNIEAATLSTGREHDTGSMPT